MGSSARENGISSAFVVLHVVEKSIGMPSKAISEPGKMHVIFLNPNFSPNFKFSI